MALSRVAAAGNYADVFKAHVLLNLIPSAVAASRTPITYVDANPGSPQYAVKNSDPKELKRGLYRAWKKGADASPVYFDVIERLNPQARHPDPKSSRADLAAYYSTFPSVAPGHLQFVMPFLRPEDEALLVAENDQHASELSAAFGNDRRVRLVPQSSLRSIKPVRSGGLTVFDSAPNASVDSLLEMADQAAFLARNRPTAPTLLFLQFKNGRPIEVYKQLSSAGIPRVLCSELYTPPIYVPPTSSKQQQQRHQQQKQQQQQDEVAGEALAPELKEIEPTAAVLVLNPPLSFESQLLDASYRSLRLLVKSDCLPYVPTNIRDATQRIMGKPVDTLPMGEPFVDYLVSDLGEPDNEDLLDVFPLPPLSDHSLSGANVFPLSEALEEELHNFDNQLHDLDVPCSEAQLKVWQKSGTQRFGSVQGADSKARMQHRQDSQQLVYAEADKTRAQLLRMRPLDRLVRLAHRQ